ncbi:saccharopine dehydrogenase (NADP+, L-glutamate-forming) [Fusarium piperis]|uniref:Saccharopine dehydrogenase (NADP+, L-glutamate-forming) n=1 Tax=Fusarium piperis TaxID=1435070 RepID=A0A9W8TDV3_9HYPO|nr:saccharopine dehydrogenase (NADP+, L-glutamate-forming) [Fusarium piperis]
MQFKEGERDLVMLQNKDGSREVRTSTLVEYGDSEKGILGPMSGKINGPILKELKEECGIFCVEETVS